MHRKLESLLDLVTKIKHLVLSPFKTNSKSNPKTKTKMTQDSSSPPKNVPLSSKPWKVEVPFGPPQIQRSHNDNFKRIRESLHKISPSGIAEKELLRKKNQYKSPLTQRNVDTFVTTQECNDAIRPNQRTPDIQVAEWLEDVSRSSSIQEIMDPQ